jgi:hypothetical protein
MEFVIQIRKQYDYHFESDYKAEMFDALKWLYFEQNKSNIPVYGVPDKLDKYAASKKDITSGKDTEPKEEHRLAEEDKYGGEAAVSSQELEFLKEYYKNGTMKGVDGQPPVPQAPVA